jgi:hypothetical protein
MRIKADVKCYFCGHISGQLDGEKDGPLTVQSFRPRPGYRGPAPRPGERLRCERCRGPIYLEDVRPVLAFGLGLREKKRRRQRRMSPSTNAA